MKILITGGAGYIGSSLAPSLIAKGTGITVYDDFRHGCLSAFPLVPIQDAVNIVHGDVRDHHTLKILLGKADVIIHLAAIVGVKACDNDPVSARGVNLNATRHILENLSKNQLLIFPTTNSGYGRMEAGTSFCDETTPLNPISLYGRLKVEAEQVVMERENSISLRLATVFGPSPKMRLDLMVNDFVYRAVNDKFLVVFEGAARRNFLHIMDAVHAFKFAVSNADKMAGQAYNVGDSSANITKLELCAIIQDMIPEFYYTEAPYRKDPDQRDYIVSNAKLSALGWNPEYDIARGVKQLVKTYGYLRRTEYANH